jgi:hypothetical protein
LLDLDANVRNDGQEASTLDKKRLALKLLFNPRARRLTLKLLKSPRVRRFIIKQITRRLRCG